MITIKNTGVAHANGYKVLEVYEGQNLIANNCDVVRINDITIDADDNGLRGFETVGDVINESITLHGDYVMTSKYFEHTCTLEPIKSKGTLRYEYNNNNSLQNRK